MRVELNILFGNNQLIFIYRERDYMSPKCAVSFATMYTNYEYRYCYIVLRFTTTCHLPPAGSMLLLLLRLIGKTKHLILFHTIALILSEKSSQKATECDFGQTEDTHTK